MSLVKVLLLEGDGIGPEVVTEAVKVLSLLSKHTDLRFELERADFGGISIENHGKPLLDSVSKLALESDAVLLGAVGGPQWDGLSLECRPERGLLELRSDLEVFANLRPAKFFESLATASPLREELSKEADFIIVRELIGGIYFGHPQSVQIDNGVRRGVSTMVYDEQEIRRIGAVAFEIAQSRKKRLVSVDKANVLDVQRLWREVMNELSRDYPDVELEHYYVDNCAMQLVTNPSQFDVLVTGNMFGDILSDTAAALTGSLGMLPSASVGEKTGIFEPVHGSAPDIAGQEKANPIAAILSLGMLLEHSANRGDLGNLLTRAVDDVLAAGYRTLDISTGSRREKLVGTSEMGDAIRKSCLRGLGGEQKRNEFSGT